MRIWRIIGERYAERAFSGEGARQAGGRWNNSGIPITYASRHLSLAALELFVHVDKRAEPLDLIAVEAEFPLTSAEIGRQKNAIMAELPAGWRFDLELTRRIGDTWSREQHTPIMLVPSVVVDVEWNVLLNPQHPDVRRLKILERRPFRYDPRMFQPKR